jgi:hypothetical protein
LSPPRPPLDLAAREPEFVTLPKGTAIERFFSAARDPIYFDRGVTGRFNSPDASYGVIYTAETIRGAFAETFLRTPGRSLLPVDFVRSKARVTLTTSRLLRLVKLSGVGLGKIGATAEVAHSGLDYGVAQ